MNSLLVRISILSISLLTVMASAAISPALGKIRAAFPDAEMTLIKLVLTLPSLLIIPFSLLGGWLAGRMKKKNLLLIGLVIYFLGGVGGGLANSVNQLLFIRALFGIGVGLIIPLSISLIADFYEKAERAKMLGYSGSVSHFGGVVFLLVSGWLSAISWRYAFGVYALSLVILLMVFLWLPEPPVIKTAGKAKAALPFGVYVCAVLGALMMVAFYAAPTSLAIFMNDTFGSSSNAGYLLSTMTLVGVFAGMFMAQLLRLFGPYCAAAGILSMAVGYGLLGQSGSMAGVVAAMLCIGFSSGTLMPLLLLAVAKITPEASRAIAMAVVSVGIYLGQFMSPVILKAVSSFPGKDVFTGQFNFLALSLGAAAVIAIFPAVKAGKAGFEEYKTVKVPGH